MKIALEPVVTIECSDITCTGISCSECPIYERTRSDALKLTSDDALKFIVEHIETMKIKPIKFANSEE